VPYRSSRRGRQISIRRKRVVGTAGMAWLVTLSMEIVERGAGRDAGQQLLQCAAFPAPDDDVWSRMASGAALIVAERGRRWRR